MVDLPVATVIYCFMQKIIMAKLNCQQPFVAVWICLSCLSWPTRLPLYLSPVLQPYLCEFLML